MIAASPVPAAAWTLFVLKRKSVVLISFYVSAVPSLETNPAVYRVLKTVVVFKAKRLSDKSHTLMSPSYSLCPCCDSSCDCCTCECESLKCCCLEVRLVSKTDSVRDSTGSSNPGNLTERTSSITPRSQGRVRSISEVSPPLTPDTSRSTSCVELISSRSSLDGSKPVLTKKKRPPLTKASKSETAVQDEKRTEINSERQIVKSHSVPSQPRLPLRRQENVDESKTVGAKPKVKVRKTSELKEVAVENSPQSSPIHSNMFRSQMQNSSNLMSSYPALSHSGHGLDSFPGLSDFSSSFNSSGFPSHRPLPVSPTTYG